MDKSVAGEVTAVILGQMQDGGLPHAGCRCANCMAAAFRAPAYVACLGLVDKRGEQTAVYLLDATPDVKHQLNLLRDALGTDPQRPQRLRPPDAIFLTHGHLGHVGGLPQLGPEAMAVQQLPVYGAPPLLALLRAATIWQPLVENLDLRPLQDGQAVAPAPDLSLTPVPVPHRDEWGARTYAFHVQGPHRSLLYLPDIDAWELWPAARDWLTAVDYALVDATFWSADELNGRPPPAHPLVPQTLSLFADIPGRLILTHLNHTNPLLNPLSRESDAVRAAGAAVAATGQMLPL